MTENGNRIIIELPQDESEHRADDKQFLETLSTLLKQIMTLRRENSELRRTLGIKREIDAMPRLRRR